MNWNFINLIGVNMLTAKIVPNNHSDISLRRVIVAVFASLGKWTKVIPSR